METNNKKPNNINIEPFMGKINAYAFTFLPKSVTGKLTQKNGDYITVELRSGSVIVAHIDSLVSIWNIRAKKEAV